MCKIYKANGTKKTSLIAKGLTYDAAIELARKLRIETGKAYIIVDNR